MNSSGQLSPFRVIVFGTISRLSRNRRRHQDEWRERSVRSMKAGHFATGTLQNYRLMSRQQEHYEKKMKWDPNDGTGFGAMNDRWAGMGKGIDAIAIRSNVQHWREGSERRREKERTQSHFRPQNAKSPSRSLAWTVRKRHRKKGKTLSGLVNDRRLLPISRLQLLKGFNLLLRRSGRGTVEMSDDCRG